jgi:hypothetical protein
MPTDFRVMQASQSVQYRMRPLVIQEPPRVSCLMTQWGLIALRKPHPAAIISVSTSELMKIGKFSGRLMFQITFFKAIYIRSSGD